MGDTDPLRFTLTSEAGLNDGSAFPFIMLGLVLLGTPASYELLGHWVLKNVLWSTVSAIGIGLLMGRLLAQLIREQRFLRRHGPLLDDFLGLGLIGVVYGACLLIDAWGFLGVFVTAVSLRHSELTLASADRPPEDSDAPQSPHVSTGSLTFKEPLERLSALVLVIQSLSMGSL